MTHQSPTKLPLRLLFRGPLVWSGVLFALVGFGLEEATGGSLAFEQFLLYGGLFIGAGCERNRYARDAHPQVDGAPGPGKRQA